jgi:hypothetical protein
VLSFDEDARRGAEGFLGEIMDIGYEAKAKYTNRCIGSQQRDVIHLEWPLRASPNGFPVFGSHIRT